ncbi:MAG: hypothetical protein J7503_13930 [Cellulomonas iranensis]|uniref:Lipoprotein n=1 Tax=Cellulomonas iranensis TaxID=76862 RepID=A0ABU0GIU4_9CELL|nr:hypothetical protein [Cellulomonas iranensis]MBO9569902.1 hypothetical protein [Cellulomonas iranensis]MDQ0424462.1 hypothetical protein [Cellulomonas iranensis]
MAGTVAAVALLAGCSGQPGAAAVVDGRTISTAELARADEELKPIFQGAGTNDVLGVLINEPFATEVAAERGVGVSDEQALDLLRSVTEQALGAEAAADAEFGEGALAVARYSLAVTGLRDVPDAQDAMLEYQEKISAADVEVNPRFGDYTPETGVTAPVAPSWIVPEGGRDAAAVPEDGSTPAPTPAP